MDITISSWYKNLRVPKKISHIMKHRKSTFEWYRLSHNSNVVAYINQTSKCFRIETLNCVLRKLKTLV